MKRLLKKYLKLLVVGLIIAVLIGGAWLLTHPKFIYYQARAAAAAQPIEAVSNTYFDVPYCNTTNIRQTLDLFTPKDNPFGKAPLVIYIHGGGWKEGDKENTITDEYAVPLANLGFAAATVDYRLSTEAKYPAQNEDVSCAVNYLVNNAEKYQLDTTKMILVGDSAGGHLAAMEALSQSHAYLGVIMAYGVSDLGWQITKQNDKNAVDYLGTKEIEFAKANSPAFAKSYPNTPFLLIHGTADTVVPAQESADFADILRSNGVDVEYLPIQNASHAFLGTGDKSDLIAGKAMFDFVVRLVD